MRVGANNAMKTFQVNSGIPTAFSTGPHLPVVQSDGAARNNAGGAKATSVAVFSNVSRFHPKELAGVNLVEGFKRASTCGKVD
jgi:hypothetical protein